MLADAAGAAAAVNDEPEDGQERQQEDRGAQAAGTRTKEEWAKRFQDCQGGLRGQSGPGAGLATHISTPLLVLGTSFVPPGDNIAAASACELVTMGVAAGLCTLPKDTACLNDHNLNVYEMADFGSDVLSDRMHGFVDGSSGQQELFKFYPPGGVLYAKVDPVGSPARPAVPSPIRSQVSLVHRCFAGILEAAGHSSAHHLQKYLTSNGSLQDWGDTDQAKEIAAINRYNPNREELFMAVLMLTIAAEDWLEVDRFIPGIVDGDMRKARVLGPVDTVLSALLQEGWPEGRP
ncbi:hypothetical protein TSOC_013671 [Tetrabaena socialis]|uniref:Uncharacterized protein n=1 Tax=Tetrabaena socialis TaxID=47790 RepID=A0A2J7ZJQ4_9CHLO|nr:hypothetical protein TSOC_013671 [Tetrabaena socialis]|eukprot:PNH00497.1 hypothetical protein TSOC_013671 [Tetrabaena socialis]